jgi:predicted nucleic acid-binding protein
VTTAVCDSGPLTHLWQVGAGPAFGTFESIHVAQQVIQEVAGHVPLEEFQGLSGSQLFTHNVTENEIELSEKALPAGISLEGADLTTLALARVTRPDLILVDDLTLRRAIEAQNDVPMGSVGILIRAYEAGLLDTFSLNQVIDNLFVHSTLYLSPKFKGYMRKLIANAIGFSGSPNRVANDQ